MLSFAKELLVVENPSRLSKMEFVFSPYVLAEKMSFQIFSDSHCGMGCGVGREGRVASGDSNKDLAMEC